MATDVQGNGHKAQDVLDFWFPATGHEATMDSHMAFWTERMQGGMDADIVARFADLTRAAAMGELDRWAQSPRGRLALVIALDQFPRSLWRDTPAAFAQDIKAARLALDGIANGDIWDLAPWEAEFFIIAISHCEGPDHLARMHMLHDVAEHNIARLPVVLAPLGARIRAQLARVTGNIARFGRHPHRNAVLSRLSTADETAYIAAGDFPHLPPRQ